MRHISLLQTQSIHELLEFTHINEAADTDTWKQGYTICLDHIKINIFMEGEFSVVVGSRRFQPSYGDLCVLPPQTLHYGQIPHPTITNYYQLDIGLHAFGALPEGEMLLSPLLASTQYFFRPDEKQQEKLLSLCRELEHSVSLERRALSFALSAQIVSVIGDILCSGSRASSSRLSPHVRKAIDQIIQHCDSGLTATELASRMNLSVSYLARLFKKELGVSIHRYMTNQRLLHAARLLRSHSVTQTAYLCSFSDSSHFISVFKRVFGCTPAVYKKRQFTGDPPKAEDPSLPCLADMSGFPFDMTPDMQRSGSI